MRNIKTREGYDLWDKLHALPRFNFWRGGDDEKGSVIRVPDKHGNWFNHHDLETLIDNAQDELNSLRDRLARLAPAEAPPAPAFDEAAEQAAFIEAFKLDGKIYRDSNTKQWLPTRDSIEGFQMAERTHSCWVGWLVCAKHKAGLE